MYSNALKLKTILYCMHKFNAKCLSLGYQSQVFMKASEIIKTVKDYFLTVLLGFCVIIFENICGN